MTLVPQDRLKRMLVLEDEGNIPDDAVQGFIDFADKSIDAALLPHYTLPITDDGALKILNVISIGLSIEMLYSFHQENDIPKGVQRIVEKAKEQLALYTGSVNPTNGQVIPPAQYLPNSHKATTLYITTNPPLAVDSFLGYQAPMTRLEL